MKNIDEVVLGIGSLAWSTVYSFAQATHLAQIDKIIPTTESVQVGLLNLVSQFGGLGLAVWLVYRHTTVTIPAMQKEHREERDAMTAHHAKMLDQLVTAHTAELERKRQDYLATLPKIACRFTEKE